VASRKNTIKTNIEANSESFLKAMDDVQKSIRTTKTEFSYINSIMKSTGDVTDDLTEHKKILTSEIDNVSNQIDILNQGLKESIDRNGEDSEATRIMREEINKASTHYQNLKNKLQEVNDKLKEQITPLGKVAEKFEEVSNVADKFASKVKWVSAGSAGLLTLGAKTAIDLEDAFVGVTKTVDGTDEQLEKVRQDIMKLSKEVPISAQELFELAETAGQLGIKVEDISIFTETMAKLGTATNMSANEAGEAIATFANIMGTLPENYERIGSTIVRLGNNSRATESDITNMALRMSGAGATLGMSESSILGLATALSSVGLEAEMGGTAISRVMNDFNRAANGMETKYGSLSQYAQICGMSTKEFSQIVKTDAGEAVKQFIIGLGDTNRTGKNTIQLLGELGVNEVRLTDTMLRLSNAGGLVTECMEMADEEWETNNALNAEASRKYADTASQIQLAKNKFTELADNFGKLMLPTINDLLGKFGKLVDWLNGLDDSTKNTIVKVGMFTATLYPLAKGVGNVSSTIGNVVKVIDKLGKCTKLIGGVQKAFTLFGGAIKGVVGAFGPWGIAIAAVIAAVVLLWTKCEWFRDFVTNAFQVIQKVASNVWNAIVSIMKPVFDTIVSIIKVAWDVIKKVFETTVSIVQPIWEKIKAIFQPVMKFFSDTWNYIVSTLKPVVDSLFNMFNEAWLLIKTIWDIVVPYFETLWEVIQTIFSVVVEVLGGYFSTAWEVIQTVWDLVQPYFETIWNIIQTIFSVVSSVLGGFFSAAWSAIKTVWDLVQPYFQVIWAGISGVFSVVKAVIGGAFEAAWAVIKTIWDTVTGYFKAIFDTIAGIFSVIRNVLTGNFSEAWEGIKGIVGTWVAWFQGIWDNIKNVFGKVKDFFKNIFVAAWDAIKNVFSSVGDFFGGIWDTIKEKFTNIAQKVGDAMSDTFKAAINGLLGMAEKVLNFPINAINKAIDILNKVPGVNIGKLDTFDLPRLELGGVLDKGARTVIAGENGAEAIVPLENNTKWINRVAEQFKTSIIDTMGLNNNYIEQVTNVSGIEEILSRCVELLESILYKPSDFYVDGQRISEATASSDDVASGELLEKIERGWAV